MSFTSTRPVASVAFVVFALAATSASGQPPPGRPWVYEADSSKETTSRRRATGAEIGSLNLMTSASRNAVLSRISGDRVYDLSVQYFIGLPSWYGVDDLPPIVARAVLIDVLAFKGVESLPDTYQTTRQELEGALAAQRVSLRPGDIVLLRGGKITLDAAEWLAEANGAMLIGGDQLSLELYKVGRPDLTVPVHNYLINQRAIAIIQVDSLEDLARDKVYEFAFIAASLRPRGAAAVQFRPLAFPLRP
ncbi:MAG TPA: cyclase family protein [Vicinamibacterales bacterium]|nr:cyclase family protein [Vicinamibacterales bacterium]